MNDPDFEFGSDGEIQERRKSKDDYYSLPPSRRWLLIPALLALMIVSGLAGALIARVIAPPSVVVVMPTYAASLEGAVPTAQVVVVTATPNPVTPSLPETESPSATPVIVVVTATLTPKVKPMTTIEPSATPFSLPDTPAPTPTLPPTQPERLLISLGLEGNLYTYSRAEGLVPLNLRGHDIATSLMGEIAYWLPTQPYLFADGKESALNSFGEIRRLGLSPNGKTLAFYGLGTDDAGNDGAGVYLIETKDALLYSGATYLGMLPFSNGAAPLYNPLTGNWLVIGNISRRVSEFREVDYFTDVSDGMLFTTVPYQVTWATFKPDGSQIIFSEAGGDIYTLNTTTKETSPLLVDEVLKLRPTMRPDGEQLAYFDDANHVYIMTLATNEIQSIQLNENIDSIAWYAN